MTRIALSSFANVALTAGVVFAVTFAVGFTLRYQFAADRSETPKNLANKGSVQLRLPPAHRPERIAATVTAPPLIEAGAPVPAAPPPSGLRSEAVAEPFDPPPPPMTEMTAPSSLPANPQLAALPSAETPEAVPAPPLAGAIAPVPTKPRIKTAWPWDARLPNAEAGADADRNRAPSGPRLNGRAIVTAALELNVAGKPLRLAGVTLPITTDLCAPNAGYAARSCADVTRQALAARVGPKGEVSCQILGGGSSAWPAVCQDRAGQDLGAYLIAHGFALADDSDMIDYSAVETQARAARSGLWSYR